MRDLATVVLIAFLLSITGCPFPDSLIFGALAVIYYHVKMLRVKG